MDTHGGHLTNKTENMAVQCVCLRRRVVMLHLCLSICVCMCVCVCISVSVSACLCVVCNVWCGNVSMQVYSDVEYSRAITIKSHFILCVKPHRCVLCCSCHDDKVVTV